MRPMWSLGLTNWLALGLIVTFSSSYASINIPVEAVQKAVVFLYAADAKGDVDSNRPVGTGFFVEVPLTSDPTRAYRVLVTARHIVDPTWAKCPQLNPIVLYARLNKKNYSQGSELSGVGFVAIKLEDAGTPTWYHHTRDDIDAAVITLNSANDYEQFDTDSIPVQLFPTDEELSTESIGDPAISAGLLPAVPGINRNYPIFKFGQISNIPMEDVATRCFQDGQPFFVNVWLIAANLVPGNSGSPIFHVPPGGNGLVFGGTRPMLLGLQSISILGADIAGMTPIKYVFEILQKIGFPNGNLTRGLNSVPPVLVQPK